MTTNQTTWDHIYKTLRRGDEIDPVCMVNVYELTNCLDELYDKIAELEARLGKLE